VKIVIANAASNPEQDTTVMDCFVASLLAKTANVTVRR